MEKIDAREILEQEMLKGEYIEGFVCSHGFAEEWEEDYSVTVYRTEEELKNHYSCVGTNHPPTKVRIYFER